MRPLYLVFLLFISIPASTQNLNQGLLACYPFSGNADDMSGNGHHGTLYGPAQATDRFGQPNSAFAFDGLNDYIDLGLFSGFTTATTFSISAWIQPDMVKLQTIMMVMPDNFNDRFNAMAYYNHNGSAATIWDFGNCSTTGRLIQIGVPFSSAWQHFVFTISPAAGMKVYKNGALNISQNASSSFINRNKNLWIGGGWDASNAQFFFQGSIDDIRLYDRELTAVEVQQLYTLQGMCTPTGLETVDAGPMPFSITVDHGQIIAKATKGGRLALYDTSGKSLCGTSILKPDELVVIDAYNQHPAIVLYQFFNNGAALSGKLMVDGF